MSITGRNRPGASGPAGAVESCGVIERSTFRRVGATPSGSVAGREMVRVRVAVTAAIKAHLTTRMIDVDLSFPPGQLLPGEAVQADIEVGRVSGWIVPHRAVVTGPTKLRGQRMESPDIRAGMSMLLASLCAQGESTIGAVYQIDKGYERIDERLRSVGARIERVSGF